MVGKTILEELKKYTDIKEPELEPEVKDNIKYYHDKLKFRDKFSSMMTSEQQEELFSIKVKPNINKRNILGKVYGYFFDN